VIRLPVILVLLSTLLTSCSQFLPRKQPEEALPQRSGWRHAPAWARAALQQDWWKGFENSQLDSLISTALSRNPDLGVLSKRLERSRAQTRQVRATAWPTINLNSGFLPGREQSRATGWSPLDLEPWANDGSVSWELDLFGQIKAGTRAAREAEQAALWDLHAGRLLTATAVAGAHFRILRLNEEYFLVASSVSANQKILTFLRARKDAGLLSETLILRQEAEHENLTRSLLDLERLRGLALLQLETLCGGESLSRPSRHLSACRTPPLPTRTSAAILAQRPDMLAAEARLRSAFELEESKRLGLLPSLTLGGSARSRGPSLLSDFRQWIAKAGPSLDLPIYSPSRMAAIAEGRAATDEAAALYRKRAIIAFKEVESSYLNLGNRHNQLQAARREVASLEQARQNTLATFKNGLVSQIELLESERRSLEGKRQELAIRHALLRDHLTLIRALGGGSQNKAARN